MEEVMEFGERANGAHGNVRFYLLSLENKLMNYDVYILFDYFEKYLIFIFSYFINTL